VGRTVVAFAAALGSSAWLGSLARSRALAAAPLASWSLGEAWSEEIGVAGAGALGQATATALVMLVAGPALVRLPGLKALRRPQPWRAGGSSRRLS
jgi:ABC-type uncharacterized transport system permease subunit